MVGVSKLALHQTLGAQAGSPWNPPLPLYPSSTLGLLKDVSMAQCDSHTPRHKILSCLLTKPGTRALSHPALLHLEASSPTVHATSEYASSPHSLNVLHTPTSVVLQMLFPGLEPRSGNLAPDELLLTPQDPTEMSCFFCAPQAGLASCLPVALQTSFYFFIFVRVAVQPRAPQRECSSHPSLYLRVLGRH